MRKTVLACAAALLSSVACAATNVVTNVTAATMLKHVPTTTVLSNLVNLGAGSPTNRLLWTSVTNITSRKRDLDDLRVYRRMNDCWTWTDWANPMEPEAKPAPADFLAFANSPGSKPIYFKNDGWFGGTQFWPNGKRKYMKDPGPGGLGKETDLNFAFTAYDETGTNELFRFGAHAHRENPTNETFVSWSDKPVNEFVRVATTDMVDWNLAGKTDTNDFVTATNDLWEADELARAYCRDKFDRMVYEPELVHWGWASTNDEFNALANRYGAPKPQYDPVASNWLVYSVGRYSLTNGLVKATGLETNLVYFSGAFTAEVSRTSGKSHRPNPVNGGITLVDSDELAEWVRSRTYTNDFVTATNDLWNARGGGGMRVYPKYLEFMEVADTYPEEAKMYYDQAFGPAACSSFRDGGFHYRNYDWNFDSSCVFVVSTLAGPGRFASIGVGGVGTNLTEEIVSSGERTKWYKAVPGHMLDGINEKGVCVNINVISSHGHTNGWHGIPAADGIHCLAAVRWVLDSATNAQHAATELANRVYVPQAALDKGYSFHYMVSDEDSTWIAEDGQCRSYPGRVAMTNVRSLDENDPCGTGRERLAILNAGGSITDVWFTKAYTDEANKRLSEFVVTGTETEEELTAAWQAAHDYWITKPKEEHRNERPGGESWWQTVHTAVYDLANRSVKVCVQEDSNWYSFQVPATGGSSGVAGVTEKTVTNIVESYRYMLDTSKDWFNLRAFEISSDAPGFNLTAWRATVGGEKGFHGEAHGAFRDVSADVLYGFVETAPKFVLSAEGTVGGNSYKVDTVSEIWGPEEKHVYSNALTVVSADLMTTNRYDVTLRFVRDEIVRKSQLDNQPVYTSFQDVTNLVRTVPIPQRKLDPAQSNFGIWEFEIGDSIFGSGTVKCEWGKDRWHGSLTSPTDLDFTITGVNTNGTYEFEVYEATNDLRIAWTGLGTLETNLTYRSLGIFRVKPVLESRTIGEDEVRALVAAHVPEVDVSTVRQYRIVDLSDDTVRDKQLVAAAFNDCGTVSADYHRMVLPPKVPGKSRDIVIIFSVVEASSSEAFLPVSSSDLEGWSQTFPTWNTDRVYRVTFTETRVIDGTSKWEFSVMQGNL